MNKTLKTISTVLLSAVLMALLASCGSSNAKSIVGVWQWTETGLAFQFLEDGSMVIAAQGQNTPGTYEFVNDTQLKLNLTGPAGNEELILNDVKVDGEELSFQAEGQTDIITMNKIDELPAALSISPETGAPTEPCVSQTNPCPTTVVDPAKTYFATFKMEKGGEFVIQLYPEKAPVTVNSFVYLAQQGYFDGLTFHRVLEGFMAQGGDPTGTGSGGPGYQFINEKSDLVFDKAGVLAMANAGPNTNGSQFFITFAPADFLNGGYTIFGQVIEGMDVVNGITRRDPDSAPSFTGDVIESVTITEQ